MRVGMFGTGVVWTLFFPKWNVGRYFSVFVFVFFLQSYPHIQSILCSSHSKYLLLILSVFLT